VARLLALIRAGAVGFIDWLGADGYESSRIISTSKSGIVSRFKFTEAVSFVVSCETQAAKAGRLSCKMQQNAGLTATRA
jgi:hypothetical protein